MTALAIVVHWVHVLGAAVWFGAQTFLFAALWPALLGRPVSEARALLQAVAPRMARIMAWTGPVVMVSGLLRGTLFGPLRSWQALVGTAYGHTFLVALALVGALTAYGGRARAGFATRLWDGDRYRPGAGAYLRRFGAGMVGTLAAIVGCMVLMRFGI
jgi:putative copper export protein